MNDNGNSTNVEALAVLQGIDALALLTDPQGPERILSTIRAAVCNEVADLTTDRGRKAVASRARKVSSAKIYMDDAGKALVVDWKAKAKVVDVARKTLRDGCDAIRDEVRKPLTEWEEAERARLEAAALAEEVEAAYAEALVENVARDEARRAAAAAEAERLRLEAENAELKRQAQERERVAREEQIRREAEERAIREAQEKVDAARRAQERAEQDKRDAEVAAKERERLMGERVEREKEQAAQRAEAEKREVLRLERERQERAAREEQERKVAEEARQRAIEEDKEHRKACAFAARDALEAVLERPQAEAVLRLIAAGKVPHVRFDYSAAQMTEAA